MNQKKHRFGGKFPALLILLALVVMIGMGSTTLLSKSVTLVYDGQETVYSTTADTVEKFLEEEEIELEDYAYLSTEDDEAITNEMEIEIRSPKKVIVLDNGIEETISTGQLTVEEILEQHGYELNEKDYTVPGINEEIDFSQEEPVIIINRVYHKTVTDVVSVPFETVTRENDQLEKGKEKIVTEGQNGTNLVTTAKTIINDQEVDSSVIEEEVIKAPVNQVKEIGTKVPQPVLGGGAVNKQGNTINGMNVKRVINMEATAYDASPASNGKWAGVTALGTNLRPGVVAVDRNVIPLGTKLYIESNDGWPSYGMAVAEDVGGAIKGNRIDLFFESSNTVRNFGRRNVTVYVLGN